MRGAIDLDIAAVGHQGRQLSGRPAWPNILGAVDERGRNAEVGDLAEQGRALDVRLPTSTAILVDALIRLEHDPAKILANGFQIPVVGLAPSAIIDESAARDADQPTHPGRVSERVRECQIRPEAVTRDDAAFRTIGFAHGFRVFD